MPEGTVVGEWMDVDITAVLQEIIDRSDWTQGSAIAIFTEYTVVNSEYYLLHSYGATTPYPPELEIVYLTSS